MRKLASIENKIVPAVFMMLLVIIWEIIVDKGLVNRFILPSPLDVARTLVKSLPAMKDHILVTLEEAAIGFSIAVALSVFLAVLMDSVALVRKAVYPIVVVSQTIPIITLAPLFVIWFGFGLLPKVIAVILVCFFPVTISLVEGLASVDTDMVNMMKSMGATNLQIMKFVKLPASMVNFFSGLRIAATYSIMGAVIGEWLGGEKGLGIYIQRAKHSYDLPATFAAIVVIVILSMLFFKLISVLQDLSIPWHKLQKRNSGGVTNE
jgi:ABC-type nitrate/sulfonate/bicarbonate transport system permease component